MINKELILSKSIDNNITGILSKVLEAPIQKNGFIIKNYDGVDFLELYNPEGKRLCEDLSYYILKYAKELLDKDFNSILVGGLGLGIIPFAVQDFCDVIDVIEIEPAIIDINAELNVLNSKVNVIEADIFTFQPTKNYDIVVMDVIYRPYTIEEMDLLNSIYLPHINEGGFIYYPINILSKTPLPVIVNK